MYNIETATETQITADTGDQYSVAIYGDRIVWENYENDEYDIYMYDIETTTETQMTPDLSGQYLPRIYENKIVWEDDRNDNSDIYIWLKLFLFRI